MQKPLQSGFLAALSNQLFVTKSQPSGWFFVASPGVHECRPEKTLMQSLVLNTSVLLKLGYRVRLDRLCWPQCLPSTLAGFAHSGRRAEAVHWGQAVAKPLAGCNALVGRMDRIPHDVMNASIEGEATGAAHDNTVDVYEALREFGG
jgi:hypothetical protein